MAFDQELQRETEFQRRKVASLERYVAQIELEVRMRDELELKVREYQREYAERLKQEREYLDWLEGGAKYEDAPNTDSE